MPHKYRVGVYHISDNNSYAEDILDAPEKLIIVMAKYITLK